MLEIRKKPEAVENGIFQINLHDKSSNINWQIIIYFCPRVKKMTALQNLTLLSEVLKYNWRKVHKYRRQLLWCFNPQGLSKNALS